MFDFQQVANLKEKKKQRIYSKEIKDKIKEDLQKIEKPVKSKIKLNLGPIKSVVFILAFLIVCWTIYNLFFKNQSITEEQDKNVNWYAIKLINNEIFYGQIKNTKADPIVVANVYYNYDQKDSNQKQVNETNSLRLVKRGKETHGPVGVMDIVRSQVLFMELLKADSKALQAILEYEK